MGVLKREDGGEALRLGRDWIGAQVVRLALGGKGSFTGTGAMP